MANQDWQSDKSLSETNLHMLKNQLLADVKFIVGKQKETVVAHKFILVSRSCVFEAMFCGPMSEKNIVEICDVESRIFEDFLRSKRDFASTELKTSMASSEFQYCDNFDITNDIKKSFDQKGYIVLRGLFDNDEVYQLKKAVNESDAITKFAQGVPDGQGRQPTVSIWRHPGDDVTGMIARCEKVAGFSEKLLGGEVYHYHGKLIMKDAKTGGKFVWHQDYGYWYKNGIVYPDLLSVFIPVDRCVKENGCLQILEGSHLCGRIDHVMKGGQTGADMERVEDISKVCPPRYVELEPGDALFFHSNLLHTSSVNDSDLRRYVLICCYNRASNNPLTPHEYPQYTKLNKVPNRIIKECKNFRDVSSKEFVDLRNDKTVRVTEEQSTR